MKSASRRNSTLSAASKTYLTILISIVLTSNVNAQQHTATTQYNIPSGDLTQVVNGISRNSGFQIAYDISLLKGKQAPVIEGALSLQQALDRALSGTGLIYEIVDPATVVIKKGPPPAPRKSRPPRSARAEVTPSATEAAVETLEAVTVTGTRIRGGTSASPSITISDAQIREQGFNDLGEVIRSIPQNFRGGQNPGVVGSPGSISNQNISGGSGLNLRGLGPDATLTLLNGRRLSGTLYQAVDISAIPVEAVDRIEIIADGASAIYGSDAVGGVGNVILKKDYDGVSAGWRYGSAAEGGLETRDYSLTAGVTWSTGGLITTYKNVHADPIYTEDRDYTRAMYRPYTIYPGSSLTSGLISAHQSIGDSVDLKLDALRTSRDQLTYSGTPTYYTLNKPETITSIVSPSVDVALPSDWTLSFSGAFSKDQFFGNSLRIIRASGVSIPNEFCYCSENKTYEAIAEGPILSLAAGEARLAVGVGHRTSELSTPVYRGNDGSRYAYAEVNVPLVPSHSAEVNAERLALTAAIRAEDYDSFGGVTTPKLGLIYRPSGDFTLKASWGKSFKAPTLEQRYALRFAYLDSPSFYGATDLPPEASVIYSGGANPDLGPERARTWNMSVAFHPIALPGLEAELTWFDIDYKDRVAAPIGSTSQALSNPAYAQFIYLLPSAEQQSLIINAAGEYFYNFIGVDYDPSNVAALILDNYTNVTKQRIKGLDLTGSYRHEIGESSLTYRAAVSWLDSSQQTTPGQAAFRLSGTMFNPAELNGRLGAVLNNGKFSASFFANYSGGVTDIVTSRKTASVTTLDTTLRYDVGVREDVLSGFELSLSAQNLLDRSPPLYVPSSLSAVPYDSTNYSAIGRYVSFSLAKRW